MEEDINLTVASAQASITGSVELYNETPVADAAVRLVGGKPRRTTVTDVNGRYQFFDIPPGRYRLKLDRPTKRDYRASVVKVEILDNTTDLTGIELLATPR